MHGNKLEIMTCFINKYQIGMWNCIGWAYIGYFDCSKGTCLYISIVKSHCSFLSVFFLLFCNSEKPMYPEILIFPNLKPLKALYSFFLDPRLLYIFFFNLLLKYS